MPPTAAATLPLRTRRTSSLLPLLSIALVTGCGPFLVLPGGALDGAVAEAPSDWAFSNEIDTVQLETRPSDPYSVNIWVIGLGSAAYVHAGAKRSTWVEHMEADPSVRLQVEGTIYALEAARVTEQAEFDRFSDAYEMKYGRRPRNESVTEAYLFRLTAP